MKNTRGFEFSNGDAVVEKVTGFTGVITGVAFYITGCASYLVTSRCTTDTEKPTALWYDEGRLELLKKEEVSPAEVAGEDNGCDIMPPGGSKGA